MQSNAEVKLLNKKFARVTYNNNSLWIQATEDPEKLEYIVLIK